jgi:hypothetical protein
METLDECEARGDTIQETLDIAAVWSKKYDRMVVQKKEAEEAERMEERMKEAMRLEEVKENRYRFLSLEGVEGDTEEKRLGLARQRAIIAEMRRLGI